MHCPECGFVNAEGSNYCQKCGAFLADVGHHHEEGEDRDTTVAWQIGETGDLKAVDPEQIAPESATLVIRSGGGRSGETFVIDGVQARIGRSPEAEVFLDDVTVSRNHALLVRRHALAAEDVGELLNVGSRDHGLALLAPPAKPVHQLGPEDVDLAVQDAAAVGDLLLLPREFLDQVLQLLILESPEIRESVHAPSLVDAAERRV